MNRAGGGEGGEGGGEAVSEFPSALVSVVFMILGPLMKEKKERGKKKDGNGLSRGKEARVTGSPYNNKI